jgi:hypothetical protein
VCFGIQRCLRYGHTKMSALRAWWGRGECVLRYKGVCATGIQRCLRYAHGGVVGSVPGDTKMSALRASGVLGV